MPHSFVVGAPARADPLTLVTTESMAASGRVAASHALPCAAVDATEFRRASHSVWEAMAPGWDDRHAYMEESARPVAERMLEFLAPAPGQTVLELAAGTGVVGFAAAALVQPGGTVVVSDFSQAMVAAARRHADELGIANVDCRVLDAEDLDLPDDAV